MNTRRILFVQVALNTVFPQDGLKATLEGDKILVGNWTIKPTPKESTSFSLECEGIIYKSNSMTKTVCYLVGEIARAKVLALLEDPDTLLKLTEGIKE